jgi:hypothetical protein
MSRPCRKNVAGVEVKEASDRQGPVGQWDQQERGEQHRRQLWKVRRRSSRSSVVSRRDGPVRSKVHGKVNLHKIRHKVRINEYGSVRRRLWEQANISSVVQVRHLDFGNQSRRLLVAEPRVRRAAKEKECRALKVSCPRHNSTSSRNSGSPAARLPQRIRARVVGSQKAGKEDNQDKHHRQGNNNILAQSHQRLRNVKTPESLLFSKQNCRASVSGASPFEIATQ